MEATYNRKSLRWATLIIVLVNTVFNYVCNFFPIGKSIGEITLQYHTLFTPANYAFSIWGIIYFTFIIYAIYQLLPAQQNKLLYDKISTPLIFVNTLSILWILAFQFNHIGLSTLIIFIMWAIGFWLFSQVKHARNNHKYSSLLTIPFSIYFGWISVALIANTDILLASMNWYGGKLGTANWSIILIALAFISGVIVCVRYKDLLFPLVVSWALIAIWINLKMINNQVALTALMTGVILLVLATAYSIKRVIHKKQLPSYSGSCVMKIVR
jgi:hypothetical protein